MGLLVKIYKRFAERFLERLYPFMFLATVHGNLFLHIFHKYVLSIYFIFASLRGKESLILFRKCYNYQWTMSKLSSSLLLHLRLKQLLFFLFILSPFFLPLLLPLLDSWFFSPSSLCTGDKMIHDEIPSRFFRSMK